MKIPLGENYCEVTATSLRLQTPTIGVAVPITTAELLAVIRGCLSLVPSALPEKGGRDE